MTAQTMRWAKRFLLATAFSAAVAAAGWAVPAGAGSAGAGSAGAGSGDPGLREFCGQLAQNPPQGGAQLILDPPQGASLRAGETVRIVLRWDRGAFAGADLRRAAHCIVTPDGRLRLDLSGVEAPSANDGEYRGSFTVPRDLAPGECLCVLGLASGDGADGGGPLRLGGNSCVTVTEPAPPTPPTTTATPPVTGPPARPPAEVLPATQTAPPPGEQVSTSSTNTPLPLAELPRTGSQDVRLLLAVGGLALVLGGGAITTRR